MHNIPKLRAKPIEASLAAKALPLFLLSSTLGLLEFLLRRLLARHILFNITPTISGSGLSLVALFSQAKMADSAKLFLLLT